MRTLNKILLVVSLLAVAFVVYKIFFPSGKPKATTYYQTQSKGEGSAEETFIRAMKYMVGEDGFPQNSNMAAKLLKEAAEKGHANAQFNLAVCFARGIGVNMDHGQTLIWLEKAAANGHPQAKEFLEELKRDGGLEAPADLKEVTEAAEKGDAEAQCKLAMYYYMGQGVPRDLDKMIFWLEKSAGQGFAEAQFRLGCAYNDGTGVPLDEKKAAELFAKSAEQGYADGQYGLGLCYEKGEGVPKDEEQAIKWYTLAGEQGVAEAQYNLAAIYYRQGSDKEIYWLAKSADQGEIDPATGYRLALHYLEGKVVPKDAEKALDLLIKAACKNNTDAELKLSQLFYTGVGEEIPEDYGKALFWCVMAERNGHEGASKIHEELKKDPRYKEAETKLRQVLEKEEEGKQALEKDIEQKLSKIKSYDQLLMESADLMKENKYEEAKEVLQKAVAMNEDDYRAYYQLGLNAFNQIRGKNDDKENRAKCEEAIQYFDKVVEMKSSYANSYALRGVAYEMLGQDEKALENFSYYLELVDENDNSTLTKQVIARYQRLSGER